MGSLSLLQGIFSTQGLNPGLPHWGWILYQLSQQGSPGILEWAAYPFSRGSSWPRNWTGVSCIAGGFFTSWAIRRTLKKSFSLILQTTSENITMKLLLSLSNFYFFQKGTAKGPSRLQSIGASFFLSSYNSLRQHNPVDFRICVSYFIAGLKRTETECHRMWDNPP